jgi:hypothetical protein
VSSPIFLDDEQTWPSALIRILEGGLPVLDAFFSEERRISRLARDIVQLRIYPPRNAHRADKESIYGAAACALKGHSVVGWHCTRLCDDEIELLRRDGMYPLSLATFIARLERRIEVGDIPSSFAATYRELHQAAEPNRHMLWFIFSRESLRDEDGLGRLFSSWGGEALYNSHERNPQTGPVLRAIGTPCIVEAEMPFDIITAFFDPAEWVARAYLHRRDIDDGHSPQREGYIREPLGADCIRRVISVNDPDFEKFTGASTWRHYRIKPPA